MGKFQSYRYLQLLENTSNTHISPRPRPIGKARKLRKLLILLIIAIVLYSFGLFAGRTLLLDKVARTFGYANNYHYAIIIDAGSSGSRVLAYKFRVPLTLFGRANLEIDEEYFAQSQPGLSSYVDDPQKGAETIVQLIKKAEHLIPKDARAMTPLIVRATAGLRLLPEEKANILIEEVKHAISKLEYEVGADAVGIMDGADEGVYIWYTVNLLTELLWTDNSMMALDLGGGSTQITFQGAPEAGSDNTVPLSERNISVYTHSYLNLGLNAARAQILREENQDPAHTTSMCVEPIIQNELWSYAGVDFNVSGAERPTNEKPSDSLIHCVELAIGVVRRHLSPPPPALASSPSAAPHHRRIAAMSYFYDIAADAGLIDVMTGGSTTVKAYKQAALIACSSSNVEQPWACVDLVYAYTLLYYGYKFDINQPIFLFKKIKGHEVSWALGLAYTTVENRIRP